MAHSQRVSRNIKTQANHYFGAPHYGDVIMATMASQITSLTIVYSTVYSGADQRKHQSSASLAFVRGIPRGPLNSPHKWSVTRKMFPFDDVIMTDSRQAYLGQRDCCRYHDANRAPGPSGTTMYDGPMPCMAHVPCKHEAYPVYNATQNNMILHHCSDRGRI